EGSKRLLKLKSERCRSTNVVIVILPWVMSSSRLQACSRSAHACRTGRGDSLDVHERHAGPPLEIEELEVVGNVTCAVGRPLLNKRFASQYFASQCFASEHFASEHFASEHEEWGCRGRRRHAIWAIVTWRRCQESVSVLSGHCQQACEPEQEVRRQWSGVIASGTLRDHITTSSGNGSKPIWFPNQPGCCSVAPTCPHLLHTARRRIRLLDAPGPHR